ncbi:phenylalanine--tRNA ligase beta subunit-related protein, partial [Pseudomonas syringae pv. tagetis]
FDLHRITGDLMVREAIGDETYQGFSGDREHPAPGEVIFVDDAGNAHARRWAHRQSALSAISPASTQVLVVAEGHHAAA